MKFKWIILLLIGPLIIAAGQDQFRFDAGALFELDSIYKFSPPQKPVYIDNIDALKPNVVDTIAWAHALLVHKLDGYEHHWYLLVEEKEKYRLLNLAPNDWNSYDHLHLVDSVQIDVNGDGTKEVVLEWDWYIGHTGWENSVHERGGGIVIWDIKHGQCLFNFNNFYQLENWWSYYEEDTTHTLSYDERELIDSGGEYECDYYNVEIRQMQIRISWSPDCGGRKDDEAKGPEHYLPTPVYVYDLHGTRFVLRK